MGVATVAEGFEGCDGTAEGGRPAALDRTPDATLHGPKPRSETSEKLSSEPVEDVGHLEAWPRAHGLSLPIGGRMRSSGLAVDAIRMPETWV